MTGGANRSWKIVTLATVMFFLSILFMRINGTHFSIYLYIWMTVAFFGYTCNLASIKVFMEVLICISVFVLAILIFLELTKSGPNINGKISWAIGVLVMLVPKIFLYNYCNVNMAIQYSETIENSQSYLDEPTTAKNSKINFPLKPQLSLVKDEALWELAFNEFDSDDQKKGLYAKLFSRHRGNEVLIKADYIAVRFDELQAAQIEHQSMVIKNEQELLKNQTAEDSIEAGSYQSRFFKGTECLFFANGQAAIKVNQTRYRLYENTAGLEKSLKYFIGSGMYLSTDLIREIKFDDQKLIIDCPRCEQKIKVTRNKELELACPACSFRWTEQT